MRVGSSVGRRVAPPDGFTDDHFAVGEVVGGNVGEVLGRNEGKSVGSPDGMAVTLPSVG